jgi:hypothetical protein
VALEPGQSVIVPGTLTRNNFTGDVNYVLDDAPDGVTGGLEERPGYTTEPFAFQINTTATVPLGIYALAVRAVGGSSEASANLTLTVAATVPSDVVSLAASPDTLSLTIGGTAVTTTITPTFRAGYVISGLGYTTSGVPAGITTGFVSNVTPSGSTAVLTLVPTTGLVAGTYPIVVTGTGIDQVARSVTVTVVVH